MRAMPPCSGGPNIDHIPQHDDNVPDAKPPSVKQRYDIKVSTKKIKSEQNFQPSKRRLSEATSLGVLLSDLLKTNVKSQEEVAILEIKKRQQQKSYTIEEVTETAKVSSEPKIEKIKKKSRNKPKPVPEVQPASSASENSSNNAVKTPSRETTQKSQDSKAETILKAQSYANYELLFPQLSATSIKAASPPKIAKPLLDTAPKFSKSSDIVSSPGIEVIRVKKKPSKKDRRKSKDKQIPRKSKPIDIKQEKTNVWGVPLR